MICCGLIPSIAFSLSWPLFSIPHLSSFIRTSFQESTSASKNNLWSVSVCFSLVFYRSDSIPRPALIPLSFPFLGLISPLFCFNSKFSPSLLLFPRMAHCNGVNIFFRMSLVWNVRRSSRNAFGLRLGLQKCSLSGTNSGPTLSSRVAATFGIGGGGACGLPPRGFGLGAAHSSASVHDHICTLLNPPKVPIGSFPQRGRSLQILQQLTDILQPLNRALSDELLRLSFSGNDTLFGVSFVIIFRCSGLGSYCLKEKYYRIPVPECSICSGINFVRTRSLSSSNKPVDGR